MKIATAQTKPRDGNIEYNLADHLQFTAMAAELGAQLIVFPEMSLTGYHRELAQECALTENDERLFGLKLVSAQKGIIIVAGAPIMLESGLHIGSFIILPDGRVEIYTKQFLHGEEALYFVPGLDRNPIIELEGEQISFAICADTSNPVHARNAAERGATMYMASIFFEPPDMERAHGQLGGYASEHRMNVLMSNYSGPSYNFPGGGRSAFWDNSGTRVAELGTDDQGILIIERQGSVWSGYAVTTKG